MGTKQVQFNYSTTTYITSKYNTNRCSEYEGEVKDWSSPRRVIRVYFLEELLKEIWNNRLVTRERIMSMFYKKTAWEYDLIDIDDFTERAITLIRIALDDISDDPEYIVTYKWTGFRIENLLCHI